MCIGLTRFFIGKINIVSILRYGRRLYTRFSENIHTASQKSFSDFISIDDRVCGISIRKIDDSIFEQLMCEIINFIYNLMHFVFIGPQGLWEQSIKVNKIRKEK